MIRRAAHEAAPTYSEVPARIMIEAKEVQESSSMIQDTSEYGGITFEAQYASALTLDECYEETIAAPYRPATHRIAHSRLARSKNPLQ